MRAVKARQSVFVAREMRRHPVEDHADAAPVQVVDEIHEVLGRAVACARGEVAGDLVAPGAVEGVLHDRHELHVREAERRYVVGERVRQLAVAERTVAFLGYAPPGADVQLVDGPGRIERVDLRAAAEPLAILPRKLEVPHHRGGARRYLGAEGVRIGLVGGAVLRDHVVLVERTGAHSGQHSLPDTGGVGARAQGVAAALPAVEIPDDRDGAGVGRPDRKARRGRTRLRGVGAKLLVGAHVAAFAEMVDVAFRQQHAQKSSKTGARALVLRRRRGFCAREAPRG